DDARAVAGAEQAGVRGAVRHRDAVAAHDELASGAATEGGGMSALEDALALHIRAHKLPEPVREYRFHPERRWRFDFAWPDLRVAAEVEGGIHIGGRHV